MPDLIPVRAYTLENYGTGSCLLSYQGKSPTSSFIYGKIHCLNFYFRKPSFPWERIYLHASVFLGIHVFKAQCQVRATTCILYLCIPLELPYYLMIRRNNEGILDNCR